MTASRRSSPPPRSSRALQRAADALDGVLSTPPPARVAPAVEPPRGPAGARAKPARAPRRRPARAAERAAPGQTQLRVIEQLRSAPGSSSTAVAQALGISANAAAATISRLVKQGRVSRVQTGGYAAADGRPAETAGADASPPAPEPDAAAS